jgi:hypothetical protein
MTTEQEKDMAIGFAITDIGLTEDEAEMEFDNCYPQDDNKYCEDCGAILIDSGSDKNCDNDWEDDYCSKCWEKHEKILKEFEEQAGQNE